MSIAAIYTFIMSPMIVNVRTRLTLSLYYYHNVMITNVLCHVANSMR